MPDKSSTTGVAETPETRRKLQAARRAEAEGIDIHDLAPACEQQHQRLSLAAALSLPDREAEATLLCGWGQLPTRRAINGHQPTGPFTLNVT